MPVKIIETVLDQKRDVEHLSDKKCSKDKEMKIDSKILVEEEETQINYKNRLNTKR